MASHTQTSPARTPDESGSGTRPAAFLRPLPSDRHNMSAADGAMHAGDRRGDEVLGRLFPLSETADGHDAASAAAAAGVRLGHFIVEERIGRGGMGGVFRAVDERLNRVVALKVLAPSFARDSAAVDRFRNEAQAAARLDHENIARVYFIGEDQGVPFIAFEFVRGINVRDFILQKSMLTPEEAVNYTLQIAQALRHTQAARVVHRDIKPSNIIITPSGHAKLVDLGLARQEQTEPARELTVPGTTLGTFDYIAPEQARDPRCVDVRADIYSLGCTLYHMLTGQPPFPQGTIIQKVVDHHRDAAPDPAVRNPLVSPQLSQIVRTMMASNPDDRYSGPDALIVELSQVAATLGLRPTHAENLIWTRPLYERQPGFFEANKGWLLTLTVLLLIAAMIDLLPSLIDRLPSDWQVLTEPLTPPPDSGMAGSPAASPTEAPPEPGPFNGMLSGLSAVRLPSAPAEDNPRLTLDGTAPAAPDDPAGAESPIHQPGDERPPKAMEAEAVVRNIEQLNSPIPDRRTPPTGNRTESSAANALPFVVIDGRDQFEKGYATLDAACERAPDGGLIELRFDGRLSSPQPPVRLQKKQLTIRAQNEMHPILEFQARADQPQGSAIRMFQVSGGGLVLQDVELRMQVRSGRSGRWALFSLVQARELSLERVSIVVANEHRQSAAVVEFALPPGDDADAMMPGSMQREQVVLDWHDCLIRAECDFIASETLDPAEIRLDNVALGVRGWLAMVYGQSLSQGRVVEDRRLLIHLHNVTALLYDGLIRVDTGNQADRDFSPIRLECERTAVVVRPEQPLIVMRGQQQVSTMQRRLRWQSRWSAVDVTGPVWEISQSDGLNTLLGRDDLDLSNRYIIEHDLLANKLRWNDADFPTLPESAFELRPADGMSSRDDETGVRFGEPMPVAGVLSTANRPRGSAPPQ